MGTNISFIRSWWFNHRLQYNKALLFTALMGFLTQALLQPFKRQDSTITGLIPYMKGSAWCFVIFLILANIAFTMGSVIDLLFNQEDSSSFREQLFLHGYWLSIGILILMIITFLYFTQTL
jgi:hypothetical protein